MKHHGLLTHVAKLLSMTDREIARKLGLSVAALRSLDSPSSPNYLRLALAEMIVDIDPDAILRMAGQSNDLLAHSKDQHLNT